MRRYSVVLMGPRYGTSGRIDATILSRILAYRYVPIVLPATPPSHASTLYLRRIYQRITTSVRRVFYRIALFHGRTTPGISSCISDVLTDREIRLVFQLSRVSLLDVSSRSESITTEYRDWPLVALLRGGRASPYQIRYNSHFGGYVSPSRKRP